MINRTPMLLALMLCIVLSSGFIQAANQYDTLVIRNVIIIDGKGTPAKGPRDVMVKKNIIHAITGVKKDWQKTYKDAGKVIDGTGKYLLPGLINIHAHLQNSRGKLPIPYEYQYKLWLACGITSVRDVGSNYKLTLVEREKSRKGEIAAPRIFLYMVAWSDNPDGARKRVKEIKKQGGDGIKIFGNDRDVLEALLDEAHKQNLRVAHHIGVEETDARDVAELGISSIEHWYGVPDAALNGSQRFPSWYNYNDENHRFRYAGHLWQEADQVKLKKVLKSLVDKGVAWNPTFVIYEANRDLTRAQNQPWFKDYLHPSLAEYFKADPKNHGSYFWNWSTADEISWKENYRIWMKAVQDFARMGGVVGVGEDAGFIYMMYGFSVIRELELHQEAGFHPIDVVQHATGNNARILGMEKKLGRIKKGFLADMIVMDGNPLENLKYLYPTGLDMLVNGKPVHRGGVFWTIKDGFVYDARQMLADVKQMVKEAREKQ